MVFIEPSGEILIGPIIEIMRKALLSDDGHDIKADGRWDIYDKDFS